MQSAHVGAPDWENPTVFGINKRNTHVPLRSHTSPDTAAAWFSQQRGAQSGIRITPLNGNDWAFRLFDKPAAVPHEFAKSDFDDSGWGEVRACGCGASANLLAKNMPNNCRRTAAGGILTRLSCRRLRCRETGRRKGTARPCTQTSSTPGRWSRRMCRRKIPPAATAAPSSWTTCTCPTTGRRPGGKDGVPCCMQINRKRQTVPALAAFGRIAAQSWPCSDVHMLVSSAGARLR